jgi:hypothetical protein
VWYSAASVDRTAAATAIVVARASICEAKARIALFLRDGDCRCSKAGPQAARLP